ncbi:hypothetical protein [Streptomyces sp. NBC_00566]|uniref:hypothetical protein n=1 Tax=Streptomyces sp. NBC_00566 TaxID=2975778 RepID=UPI002E80E83E|nr:hypothetical protein [Streptomyces sp. NBC_00566]WUB88278.1 hypothetical protein OG812_17515 [Streptomyces sp. NBC_00566]
MAHRTVAHPAPAGRPPADFDAELLPHLGVPNLATLTTDQTAGRACVWGGGPLTLATAVDLGETLHDGVHAFPRACGPCTVTRATNALAAHSIDCATCLDKQQWTDCTVGYGLLSVQRDALRLVKGIRS